jgi:hypothetical protein
MLLNLETMTLQALTLYRLVFPAMCRVHIKGHKGHVGPCPLYPIVVPPLAGLMGGGALPRAASLGGAWCSALPCGVETVPAVSLTPAAARACSVPAPRRVEHSWIARRVAAAATLVGPFPCPPDNAGTWGGRTLKHSAPIAPTPEPTRRGASGSRVSRIRRSGRRA